MTIRRVSVRQQKRIGLLIVLSGFVLALTGVVAAFAAVLAPASTDRRQMVAASASTSNETSLSQAVVGHGPSAGDKPLQTSSHSLSGVNRESAGVDAGTKKQGAGVAMQPMSRLGDPAVGHGATGGCTLGYGRGKQCLPITPPSAGEMKMTVQEMPWTCVEVKRYFPKGLPVNSKADGVAKSGVDPAHLDANHDGTACGKGDSA